MQLNLVLLILTVISVPGVAKILDFSRRQWGLVAVFLIPFSVFVIFCLRKMLKGYHLKKWAASKSPC